MATRTRRSIVPFLQLTFQLLQKLLLRLGDDRIRSYPLGNHQLVPLLLPTFGSVRHKRRRWSGQFLRNRCRLNHGPFAGCGFLRLLGLLGILRCFLGLQKVPHRHPNRRGRIESVALGALLVRVRIRTGAGTGTARGNRSFLLLLGALLLLLFLLVFFALLALLTFAGFGGRLLQRRSG